MPIFFNKKFSKLLLKSLFMISWFISSQLHADVVKPALIEISINELGEIDIEARVSIEALLTGINSQYKNTKEAPNEAEYDVLRKMQSEDLKQAFSAFESQFLNQISLKIHASQNSSGKALPLEISTVIIPEPGYTKVPRISLIKLKGSVELNQTFISWYYPSAFGDNAVRLRQVNNQNKKYHWSEWQWLRTDHPSEPFSITEIIAKKALYKTFSEYVVLGFQHILPKGLDHILFILGLFFFSAAFKPLFWQITMFTLAHTISLGLSINGIINIPALIVEPLIALSIVYIGIENIVSKRLKSSRLLLVFLFGLLHGLGFASVLFDFGMPANSFITALISFNIGVELGQLTIILAAYLLFGFWFKNKHWYQASISIPCSLLISMIASYWFIQRLDLNF